MGQLSTGITLYLSSPLLSSPLLTVVWSLIYCDWNCRESWLQWSTDRNKQETLSQPETSTIHHTTTVSSPSPQLTFIFTEFRKIRRKYGVQQLQHLDTDRLYCITFISSVVCMVFCCPTLIRLYWLNFLLAFILIGKDGGILLIGNTQLLFLRNLIHLTSGNGTSGILITITLSIPHMSNTIIL